MALAVNISELIHGKTIEVQIWPDKIEILNFPGPVPPITAKILAENKRIVARDYRNRRVGDFLKELNLTEGRGTGIPMHPNLSPDHAIKPLKIRYSHNASTYENQIHHVSLLVSAGCIVASGGYRVQVKLPKHL